MDSFVAAACQLTAGTDPRGAVLAAARSGARLVVLPAFALQAYLRPDSGPEAGSGDPKPVEAAPLAALGAELAREAGCYLAAGTVLAGPGGTAGAGAAGEVTRQAALQAPRQVAWLFAPDGRLVGEQSQTHTTAEQSRAGWIRGSELEVFAVEELGVRVGLLVGADVWVPEVSRILTLRGADLLVAPLAMPAPYSEARQVSGAWQEVQQNQTVAIEACLVGRWGAASFAGRSAVIGPCEMVPDGSGFCARVADPEAETNLLADVHLAARRKVIAEYDILAELNTDLYRQAFPHLYLGGGGEGPSGRVLGRDPRPAPRPPLPLALKERAFRAYLTLASRPSAIRRAVAALGLKASPGTGPGAEARAGRGGRGVRVAALQLESFYARSPGEYVERVGRRFAEAVQAGARLVAFPELVTIPLIGLLPGVADMAAKKAAGAAASAGASPAAPAAVPAAPAAPAAVPAAPAAPASPPAPAALPRLADVVRFMEPVLRNVYFTLFSALAAAARVWIMAGSTPLPGPDGKVYNVAALFGPDGSLVGTQSKLHLFPRERTEGLSPGSRLTVFDTDVGRLALPICMDATYFETYRLAALLGAEIVAAPVSNVEPYDYWKLLRGAWPRVQETPVYAVQSTIVGDFLGDPMTGKASVFAPLELTPDGSGVLAQCPEPVGPGLAVADLDLDALTAFRAERSLFARLNPEVIRRYLPAVYEEWKTARGEAAAGEEPRD